MTSQRHCSSLATSDDNTLLLTADGGGTVKVWKTAPLARRLRRMLHHGPGGSDSPEREGPRARFRVGEGGRVQICIWPTRGRGAARRKVVDTFQG